MASPAYEGSRLPTSSPIEGEVVDDVFEGRLETTIQMRIGKVQSLFDECVEAAFALQLGHSLAVSRRGEMFTSRFGRET